MLRGGVAVPKVAWELKGFCAEAGVPKIGGVLVPEWLLKAGAPPTAWNGKEGATERGGPPKGFGAAVVGVVPPKTWGLLRVPEAEAAGFPNIPELEPKDPVLEEAAPNMGTLGGGWVVPNGLGVCAPPPPNGLGVCAPPNGLGAPKVGVVAGCPKAVAGKACGAEELVPAVVFTPVEGGAEKVKVVGEGAGRVVGAEA